MPSVRFAILLSPEAVLVALASAVMSALAGQGSTYGRTFDIEIDPARPLSLDGLTYSSHEITDDEQAWATANVNQHTRTLFLFTHGGATVSLCEYGAPKPIPYNLDSWLFSRDGAQEAQEAQEAQNAEEQEQAEIEAEENESATVDRIAEDAADEARNDAVIQAQIDEDPF